MPELLQLIQEGNVNLEAALQALIKQEMDNGATLEVAIQALIKQAQDQDLQPVVDALIKLQQNNQEELLAKLDETSQQTSQDMGNIADALSPIAQLAKILMGEAKGEKGDSPTDDEIIILIKPLIPDPVKGDQGDAFTFFDLTKKQKKQLEGGKGDKGDAGSDAEITEEHIAEVVSRVTPSLPTAKDIAALVEPSVTTINNTTQGQKLTKKTIGDLINEDLKNFKIITGTDIVDMLNARSGRFRIDINAIKGLEAFAQELGGHGGRGEPHTFLEAPDTPSTYEGSESYKVRVNAEGTALEFVADTGSATWVNEVPTGAVNNSNTVFTLSDTPISGSLAFYFNGQFQRPVLDYTLSGAVVTMGFTPAGGSVYAQYQT